MRANTASPAELQAAEFAGLLWAAITTAGGPQRPSTAGHQHFRGVFADEWLEVLPLPVDENRPASLPVALLDERDEFERHRDGKALSDAYARQPRTQVYEDIGRDTPDSWYALAARHLGRLAQCELQVVCSIFASKTGDESLGAHWDAWYGAIVQMDGAKTWRIGHCLLGKGKQPAREVTTRAGDVLLLPKGLPHAVRTPSDPGRSVHLAFAIDRDSRSVDGQPDGSPLT